MNTEIEKKWFVYVGDHHEGPFSIPEVIEKRSIGLVTDESYVWCEGMADWLMLSQVSELEKEVRSQSVQTAEAPRPEVQGKKTMSKKTNFKGSKLILGSIFGIILLFGAVVGTIAALSRTSNEELHANLRPMLTKIADAVPAFSGFFKLVPNLTDVKPDELFELESARMGAPMNGVKINLALSSSDPNRPYFYLSTNLPHHTKFDIYLLGHSETLLNRLQFNAQGTLSTHQGFGKSEVFLADGGQPLPKGQYQVFVTEASEQEASVKELLAQYPGSKPQLKAPASIPTNAKFMITKTFFIGGERDETYLTRLKAFHEKIKQGAEKESLELKQYSETLASQLNALSGDFQKVYQARKPSAALKNNWKKNVGNWNQLSTQLDQTIQTWSKETLQNEFFYGKVYELVKGAYQSMKALFQLENEFMEKPQDKAAFEIQHGKLLSEARQSVQVLNQKMDMISKAPKTPSGLPTREGL